MIRYADGRGRNCRFETPHDLGVFLARLGVDFAENQEERWLQVKDRTLEEWLDAFEEWLP